MVARGDLGAQVPFEEVPSIQVTSQEMVLYCLPASLRTACLLALPAIHCLRCTRC
jgi:pyruvate kinase